MKADLILQNKQFNSCLCDLQQLELNRKFCKHDLTHLIEVARIMLILNDEYSYNLPRDLIVATALLHDIGRVKEYKYNIDHRESLSEIESILIECTFNALEIKQILNAIKSHKNDSSSPLSKLLYKADKLSRPCYTCKAYSECYWDENIKNKEYYNANRK